VKHISRKPKFKEDPETHLLHEYDKEAKALQAKVENGTIVEKAGEDRSYALYYNEQYVDNGLSETMRVINTKQSKYKYAESQLGSYVEFANLEARNIFHEGASSSKIKCILGFNQYGKQNHKISKGLVKQECSRCLQIES